MTLEEKVEHIQELAQEDGTIILRDPDYADALIGITGEGRAVYDLNKMVECLVQNDGITKTEALDFIMYNTFRALPYMGEKAPIIMTPLED